MNIQNIFLSNPALLFKGLVILESIFLIYFSLLPVSVTPSAGVAAPLEGYFQHFLAYLVYGLLLAAAFSLRSRKTFFLITAIGVGMGLLTETIQLFVPTRFFDPLDWLADLLGVVAGGFYMFSITRIKRRIL